MPPIPPILILDQHGRQTFGEPLSSIVFPFVHFDVVSVGLFRKGCQEFSSAAFFQALDQVTLVVEVGIIFSNGGESP